jgi:signal transduction histidine kinase
MLNKIKKVNRVEQNPRFKSVIINNLPYRISNSKLALVDSIFAYASAMSHNQRTQIATLSMIYSEYAQILPLILQMHEDAKKHGVGTANLIAEEQLQFLRESQDISQKCLLEMNNILVNNLKSINNAIKMSLGAAVENDYVICNISDSVTLLKSSTSLKSGEKDLLHASCNYDFKYLGNSITLNQVLANLLENALYQIRKNGKGKIFINTEQRKNVNILIFKDTAGGATAKVVKKMFDIHFTTKTDGSGIGLNFCKHAMQMFGGDIKAYAVEGESMEFMLIFPKTES